MPFISVCDFFSPFHSPHLHPSSLLSKTSHTFFSRARDFFFRAQGQRVVLGLQWEECHADTDLDIDVSCALLTPLGRVVDTVFARHPVYCYAHESVAVQFFEDPSTAPFAPQLRLCPAFLFSTLLHTL